MVTDPGNRSKVNLFLLLWRFGVIFPTVSGSNLLRQKLTLPRDFQGKLNLVFVPFYQWQQLEVNSWIPFAQELEGKLSGFYYYELPTIQRMNRLSQLFINEGMRAGIPNQTSRERTITLYINKTDFRQSLEMRDEDHIYIFLINQQGEVAFSARGSYDPGEGSRLLEVAEGLIR